MLNLPLSEILLVLLLFATIAVCSGRVGHVIGFVLVCIFTWPTPVVVMERIWWVVREYVPHEVVLFILFLMILVGPTWLLGYLRYEEKYGYHGQYAGGQQEYRYQHQYQHQHQYQEPLHKPYNKQRGYYAALGLEPDATTAEVKAAYRRLVKIHHPDVGGNPAEFIRIHAAYQHIVS